MARPSEYDFEICKEVCELITNGSNVKDALNSDDRYPSFPTWCKWKRENDELLNLYVNAIQDKADSLDSQIDEIWKGCKEGLYDASIANVLIQTLKWKMSKYYPKMFGDKNTTILEGGDKPIQTIDYSKLSEDALKEIVNAATPSK